MIFFCSSSPKTEMTTQEEITTTLEPTTNPDTPEPETEEPDVEPDYPDPEEETEAPTP